MTNPGTEPSSTPLDQNVAAAVAYLGGFVSGIALLVIEKQNKYVRFHAMQSTVLFISALIATIALNSVPLLGPVLFSFILFPAVVIIWLVMMFKAFNGERFKLPVVGDFAERQL